MGTARTSPVEDVITAIVTALKADAPLLALTTRIYNNVPQDTAYPYVEVTSPSDARIDTFARYGSTVLVDVKAVSQAFGDKEPSRILDACITALNNTLPSLTSHTTRGVAWDGSDRFREVVNGIVTRHHVGTFRIWSEQQT